MHAFPAAASRVAGHVAGGVGVQPAFGGVTTNFPAVHVAVVRQFQRGSSPYSQTAPSRVHAAPPPGALDGHAGETPTSLAESFPESVTTPESESLAGVVADLPPHDPPPETIASAATHKNER